MPSLLRSPKYSSSPKSGSGHWSRFRRLKPTGRDDIGQSDVVDKFIIGQARDFLEKRLGSEDFAQLEFVLSGRYFFDPEELQPSAGPGEDRRYRRGSAAFSGATDSRGNYRREPTAAQAKAYFERFPNAAQIGHV